MIILLVVCSVLVVCGIAMVFMDLADALDWEIEPKVRERGKVKRLKARVAELEATVELLDEKNVKLSTELVAYRNKLPWVHVEELDGPQE